MKYSKHLFAILLALSLLLGLCACGSSGDGTTTDPSTKPQESTAETTESTGSNKPTYTVKVVDEAGNPISGVIVQLCLDMCYPSVTDASGIAKFEIDEAEYKVSVTKAPDGYSYSVDEVFYFKDSTEMTITLKAAA